MDKQQASSPNFTPLDALMESGIRQGVFPCASIAIGRGNRVLYRRAYGKLSPEKNAPLCTTETLFDLASVTKPLVTATLCMLAVEEGRLCLWDSLGTFWRELPPEKSEITLKQLLLHTAGFSDGLGLWRKTNDPRDILPLILRSELSFSPGSHVLYACANYILLGFLLEKVYGCSLDALAREKIFQPLHMEHSCFNPPEGSIASTEKQADGSFLCGRVHDETARLLGGVAGNAGLFSTAGDLCLYLQMLHSKGALPEGGRLLSSSSVRLMETNLTPGLEKARSIGFHLPNLEDGYTGDLLPPETIGHTGFTGTSVTLDPVSGLYFVLLTNRVCPSRDNAEIHRFRRLAHNLVYSLCESAR